MKTAIKSKTIIFNVFSGILVALMFITPIVPEGNFSELISAVIVLVNIILRFKTDTAIKGVM